MVSKRKYDRELKRVTKEFIKEQSAEDNLLFLGAEVKYDSVQLKNDSTKTAFDSTIKN